MFFFFTYIYADRNGNIFQCQTYKCAINVNEEGEANLKKKYI